MITIYILYKYFLPTLCSNMRSVFVGRNVLGMFSECSRNVLYFGIILGGGLNHSNAIDYYVFTPPFGGKESVISKSQSHFVGLYGFLTL